MISNAVYGHIFYALAICVGVSCANAQDITPMQNEAQLSWYRNQTETIIKNSKRQLEPQLSSRELDIERNIEYRVVLSGNVNARATYSGSTRQVTISAGLVQVLSWVVDAYISENELKFPGCFDEYLGYLTEGVARNSQLVQAMRPPRAVGTVFWFANSSMAHSCSGLTPDLFKQNPEAMSAEAGFMNTSIFFIFAHETAHHILNHTDNPPQNNEQSRRNEAAADAWAFNKAFMSNESPFGALPTFIFLAAFSGNSIEDEVLSTHPLGIRRLQSMLDAVDSLYATDQRFRRRLEQAGTRVQFEDGLKAVRQAVNQRMHDLGIQ